MSSVFSLVHVVVGKICTIAKYALLTQHSGVVVIFYALISDVLLIVVSVHHPWKKKQMETSPITHHLETKMSYIIN